MRTTKKQILSLLLLLPLASLAQGSKSVEMADSFREDGKIYVVVAGLVIILTGVVIFLIRVDRKLTRLERDRKQ
jgi:hypothetical protein